MSHFGSHTVCGKAGPTELELQYVFVWYLYLQQESYSLQLRRSLDQGCAPIQYSCTVLLVLLAAANVWLGPTYIHVCNDH